ncbi:unnamed protein product [Caenorhabditis auriculariae]|uniref:C2H2-type domain-containing protein n=1 Tax=Caenorhabditis auriculariae TaxID=2777116 RepID=A0A8S1HIA0_9PELO|nr:unnamed protein product [Caenorhabditis auriculariae]
MSSNWNTDDVTTGNEYIPKASGNTFIGLEDVKYDAISDVDNDSEEEADVDDEADNEASNPRKALNNTRTAAQKSGTTNQSGKRVTALIEADGDPIRVAVGREVHRDENAPDASAAAAAALAAALTTDSREECFSVILPEEDCPYGCKKCHRGFYTIRELAEHEIRTHGGSIPCSECPRVTESVTKLAAHVLFRHPNDPVICRYCREEFGKRAEDLDERAWTDFRQHVYKEALKKKVYEHNSRASNNSSNGAALRGVGRCPHGAPVKCKNFPSCPGAKCIYSHGQCRYDSTCNKSTCPFDHSHRPRTCMACVNDLKHDKRRR